MMTLSRRAARRLFTLYATDSRCTHLSTNRRLKWFYSWTVLVRAVNTRQAFKLAYDRIWATGPKEIGMHRLEWSTWHHEQSEEEARAAGSILEAPYLCHL